MKGSRDLIASETAQHLNKLVFDNDCFCHQYHIIVFCLLYGLESIAAPALDIEFKVYSAMAQILHLWRDNVREVFDAYLKKLELKKQLEKIETIRKVPPRPIAGRWGRSSACISYLLNAFNFSNGEDDWQMLQEVLIQVFSGRSYFAKVEATERAEAAAVAAAAAAAEAERQVEAGEAPQTKSKAKPKRRGKKRKLDGNVLDETAADENKAWESKMGKWAKGGVAGIQSLEFWIVLMIADVILKRLDVLQFTIMKKREHIGNLAHLVFSGGVRVLKLLEELLKEDAPWEYVFAFVERHCPERLPSVLDVSRRLFSSANRVGGSFGPLGGSCPHGYERFGCA